MAGLTKVWNKDSQPYSEEFEGDTITIPANGFIEMTRSKAVKFKGTAVKTKVTDTGIQTSQPKMIALEHAPIEDTREKFINHLTGEEFATKDALINSLHATAHKTIDPEKAGEGLGGGGIEDVVSRIVDKKLEKLEALITGKKKR